MGHRQIATAGLAVVLACVVIFSNHVLDAAGIGLLSLAAVIATPEVLALFSTVDDVRADGITAPRTRRSRFFWFVTDHPRTILGIFFVGVATCLGGIYNALNTTNLLRSQILIGGALAVMLGSLAAIYVSRGVERQLEPGRDGKQAADMWAATREPALLLVSALFIAGTFVQLLATFEADSSITAAK